MDNDDDFAKPVANEEPIRVPPLMPTVMPATIQMPQITPPILPTMPAITTPIPIPATVPAQPTQILQSTTILPTQTLLVLMFFKFFSASLKIHTLINLILHNGKRNLILSNLCFYLICIFNWRYKKVLFRN